MSALAGLLPALEARGPRPALTCFSADGRTELSGHVLANWVIKNVNLLRNELLVEPGAHLVVQLPAHWKRTVMILSGYLAGLEVSVLEPGDSIDSDPDIVATNTPGSALAARAPDVLAVEPVSLALRFSGDLGPMDLDWLQSVRSHPDALTAPLGPWSGPGPAGAGASEGSELTQIDTRELPLALAMWLNEEPVTARARTP